MTIPGHMALTFVLLHMGGCPDWINGMISYTAAYPDLGAMDETRADEWDGAYHTLHWHTLWLWLYPPTGLHLLLDRFWHKDGRWAWWGYVLEGLFWVFFIWYWINAAQ